MLPVDELNGFIEGVQSDNAKYGSKDLVLVAVHISLDLYISISNSCLKMGISYIIEDSWTNEVALWIFGVNKTSTIKRNMGSFLFSLVDKTDDSFFKLNIKVIDQVNKRNIQEHRIMDQGRHPPQFQY